MQTFFSYTYKAGLVSLVIGAMLLGFMAVSTQEAHAQSIYGLRSGSDGSSNSSSAATLDSLQAKLKAALKNIEQLQERIAKVKSSAEKDDKTKDASKTDKSEKSNEIPKSCFDFPSIMRAGHKDSSTNGAVSKLQQFLAADPTLYPEGEITGYFGELTQKAVQRFQARNNIVSSGDAHTSGYGNVGPKTMKAFKDHCRGTSEDTDEDKAFDFKVKAIGDNKVEATFTRGSSCSPYTIKWGDGEKTVASTSSDISCAQVTVEAKVTHTYTNSNGRGPGKNSSTYKVTLTQGDSSVSESVTVTGSEEEEDEDLSFDFKVKAIGDNKVEATFTRGSSCTPYTIRWGDGKKTQVKETGSDIACPQATVETKVSHEYRRNGRSLNSSHEYKVRLSMSGETVKQEVKVVAAPIVLGEATTDLQEQLNSIVAEYERLSVQVDELE